MTSFGARTLAAGRSGRIDSDDPRGKLLLFTTVTSNGGGRGGFNFLGTLVAADGKLETFLLLLVMPLREARPFSFGRRETRVFSSDEEVGGEPGFREA